MIRLTLACACAIVLAGCGGAARTVPPAAPGIGAPPNGSNQGLALDARVSPSTLTFKAVGEHASQTVTTFWRDDTRKTAVTSNQSVVLVSPPYQRARWVAPATFAASYIVTPVGPGTATITFSDHGGSERVQLQVTVKTGEEELYVGAADRIFVFPIRADGTTPPARTITGILPSAQSAIESIAVAGDGTLSAAVSEPLRRAYDLRFYAPGANGAATPNRVIAQEPGVALSSIAQSDGVAVFEDASGSLDSFGAAQSGIAPAPMRRLPLRWARRVTTDPQADIYASVRGLDQIGGVDEYAPNASGSAAPIRSIRFTGIPPGGNDVGSIAVAPDGTIYVVAVLTADFVNGNTYAVYSYAAGSSGQLAPNRIIPLGRLNGVIAVDKDGELFVGTGNTVSVYPPYEDGESPAPLRTLTMPLGGFNGSWIYSIATGP